jgi:phosphoribosylformylglycinamidine synthase
MPHPERYLHATQHPTWTRRREQPTPDGRRVFDNAVAYFRG